MAVVHRRILDPDGKIVWEGNPADGASALAALQDAPALDVLAELLDVPIAHSRRCSRAEVLDLSERLHFISRDGCAPGFLVVLPNGVLVDRCADAFNREHLRTLGAVRIDFPILFDRSSPDMEALTESYEKQRRMFRVDDDREGYRMVYAADPGIFAWLRGRRLYASRLPYTVYSPQPVFRRWKSGEIGGFDRLRQYNVPDVHLFALARQAAEKFALCTASAAESTRFWVGDSFVHAVDVVAELDREVPDLVRSLGRAARRHTLVNVLDRRPRYYAIKSGIMIHAGTGVMMLYNLQWDDVNAERFGISADNGEPVVIVHATVAGGWPKLLPLMLGRGSTGRSPKSIPVEFAAVQVMCIPVNAEAAAAAELYAAELRAHGIRAAIDPAIARPLGKRIQRARERRQPYHAVIGARESAGAEPTIVSTVTNEVYTSASFRAALEDRLERCRPYDDAMRWGLPLPFE